MTTPDTAAIRAKAKMWHLPAGIADDTLALCDALEDERAENARLRAALQKISAGEGYYGEQAREYKDIARAALAQKGDQP